MLPNGADVTRSGFSAKSVSLVSVLFLATQIALASIPYRGISIGIDTGWTKTKTQETLGEIKRLGANTVLLKVSEEQRDWQSSTVAPNPEISLSLTQLEETVGSIHALSLKMVLFPIVLIQKPRTIKDWRGMIEPNDIREWFHSYREMILKYGRLAEKMGVEMLSVGSELVSMERYVGEWKETIQALRSIYHGQLIYSANWDHLENSEAWKELDAIGCSAYFELAKKGERPTFEEMKERWKDIRPHLLEWSKTIGRPFLLVEVGVPNRENALSNPWDYTARGTSDPLLQADAYRALLDVWKEPPTPTGILFYEWGANGGGRSYSPKGTPAEEILRAWFLSR